ncbi:MAG TPA: hypothetical protein VGN77_06235 [Steroidobacteraceae bacterium]|nr:hypothetical protein [Steroidobacteraceae bacterium]
MSAAIHDNAPGSMSGPPASRPLRLVASRALTGTLKAAIAAADGVAGAHCIHELWMRGELAVHIESALERLWGSASASIPDWLPMRHIEWLPLAYEVTARFESRRRGRSNIYLVLLDYRDSREEPYGVYVGATRYAPADRFDQHKAGIRAAGSVLRRGLELLSGPTAHLQGISQAEALDIEERLAMALGAEGLFVQGGH